MATRLTSQSIPNLINGISEQNPVQRNPAQGQTQINFQSNIVEGLSKRPSLHHIANVLSSTAFPNNSAVHWINRDSDDQYVAVFTNNATPKVYDLAGNQKTVSTPNGTSYLATTSPINNLKFVNIADYTFVANTEKTILEDTATTAAKVEEFLVYCKSSNYGREYSVKLTHQDWSYGYEVQFQMPTGNDASTDSGFRDTNKIIDILLYGTSSADWSSTADGIGFKTIRSDSGATVSTTQGLANYSAITSKFTFTKYENVAYGRLNNQSKTYTVTTTDGFGNQAMYAVKDEIQDFSDLPYYAKVDMIIKITGEEGETLGDYYVRHKAGGIWSETVAPDVKLGVDNSTMPHALINNNDGTFTFKQVDWTDRVAGDNDTNPAPSFVNKKATNLTFFQNRLGILADQSLVLTENAQFFNFFITTGTDVLDTDPIDIAASGTTVNKLYNSIDFNEQLLLFSQESQYVLESSGDAVSPTTAVLTKTSSFSHDIDVKPADAGRFVYFAQRRNDKTSIVEYFADDDSLVNDGMNLTVGVSSLIPTGIHKIVSNDVEDTLIGLVHDTLDTTNTTEYTPSGAITPNYASKMYIYKYFWDSDKKAQSSWSVWDFTGIEILSAETYDSYIYVLYNENTNTKLGRIDLRNPNYSGLNFPVHLDMLTAVTGTYNAGTDQTTYTLPYNTTQAIKVVRASNGSDLPLVSQVGTAITVAGNHTSALLGVAYTSTYQFSTQYIRKGGDSTASIVSGRYQIRTMKLAYEDSGFFKVTVAANNKPSYDYTMTGNIVGGSTTLIGQPNIDSGVFSVPIQSENTKYTATITSTSHLPCHFISAEIEGYYKNRATSI